MFHFSTLPDSQWKQCCPLHKTLSNARPWMCVLMMQSEDLSGMMLSPAAFDEGDFQSTFHQPGVLNEQVGIALWTHGLNLEWEEGLVSVNPHREYLQRVIQTPASASSKQPQLPLSFIINLSLNVYIDLILIIYSFHLYIHIYITFAAVLCNYPQQD